MALVHQLEFFSSKLIRTARIESDGPGVLPSQLYPREVRWHVSVAEHDDETSPRCTDGPPRHQTGANPSGGYDERK